MYNGHHIQYLYGQGFDRRPRWSPDGRIVTLYPYINTCTVKSGTECNGQTIFVI